MKKICGDDPVARRLTQCLGAGSCPIVQVDSWAGSEGAMDDGDECDGVNGAGPACACLSQCMPFSAAKTPLFVWLHDLHDLHDLAAW